MTCIKVIKFHIIAIFLTLLIAEQASSDFLTSGFGARPVALGRAFVSIPGDINSIFYNPAGLVGIDGIRIGSSYSILFPGMEDGGIGSSNIGLAGKLGSMGNFGIALTNLGISNYRENMVYLSFSRKIFGKFSLGSSLKILHWGSKGYRDPETGESDKNLSFNGFSIDVGFYSRLTPSFFKLERFLKNGFMQVGFAIYDINQPSIASNKSSDARLPLGVVGGISYIRDGMTLALSISRRESRTKFHFGFEFFLTRFEAKIISPDLIGRFGLIPKTGEGEHGAESDFGFGIITGDFKIDYTYVYALTLLDAGGSHKFSLVYSF
ncbi:MAG: hypothetical protein ACE5QV_08925 [Fidelibacterota bacterium]